MDLILIDYLMQAVDEYNELQSDAKMRLDWWAVIDGVDIDDEQTVKTLTQEIKQKTILLKEGK